MAERGRGFGLNALAAGFHTRGPARSQLVHTGSQETGRE
jgi:hypothetical protein